MKNLKITLMITLVIFSVVSISSGEIYDHMMFEPVTKENCPSYCPDPPERKTVFEPGDRICNWAFFSYVSSHIHGNWFKPDGSVYQPSQCIRTIKVYGEGTCVIQEIDGVLPNIPGEWKFKFYESSSTLFTDHFTVRGSTTTSTVKSTTTTSYNVCYIEKIYGENGNETEILRSFRDEILSKTSEGRELISLYYQWSPRIVKAIEEDEEFGEVVKAMINEILPLITAEFDNFFSKSNMILND